MIGTKIGQRSYRQLSLSQRRTSW